MSDPKGEAKKQQAAETVVVLTAVFVAARADVLRRLKESGTIRDLLSPVWRDLLQTRVRERAAAIIQALAPDVFPERVAGKVDAYAEWFAKAWEESTRGALEAVDVLGDVAGEVQSVMDAVVNASKLRADSLSVDMGNFAAIEEAVVSGKTTKTWRTRGATTRPAHLALDGATLPIVDMFANGLQYPGAPGPPEERVNCDCYLTFN